MSIDKLDIDNLSVRVLGEESNLVLRNVSIQVSTGEIHAIMGPNGSGKTSLLYTIMGHPQYEVLDGDILLGGESILELSPSERALKGLFLTFQSPVEVPGVKLSTLIIAIHNKKNRTDDLLKIKDSKIVRDYYKLAGEIGLGRRFLRREVNVDFSGGEKKKSELLQAIIFRPRFMLLDEPDTGLDIDSVKEIAKYINEMRNEETGILIVTHYARILNYLRPDKVSVLVGGRIVDSGGEELAHIIDAEGYRRYEVDEVGRSIKS
jgi:Fe-S cluster assembly ATP-binding protein